MEPLSACVHSFVHKIFIPFRIVIVFQVLSKRKSSFHYNFSSDLLQQENPNIAATFYWTYRLQDDPDLIARQVRVTGKISELSAEKIAQFYESEPLFYKIRSMITECGAPNDWNELKLNHDKVYSEVLIGKEQLPQNES